MQNSNIKWYENSIFYSPIISATSSGSGADTENILSGPGESGSFILAEYSLRSIWIFAPFLPKII